MQSPIFFQNFVAVLRDLPDLREIYEGFKTLKFSKPVYDIFESIRTYIPNQKNS